MLNIAVVASVLTAVLVELRHHRLLAEVAIEPDVARARRTRFLLETWMLSGVCLLILALAQISLR